MLKINGKNFIESGEGLKFFVEQSELAFQQLIENLQNDLKNADTDFEKFVTLINFAEHANFMANLINFFITEKPLRENTSSLEELKEAAEKVQKDIERQVEAMAG